MPPAQLQQLVTVRSEINIKKNSIQLDHVVGPKWTIVFQLDTDVDVLLRCYFFATEKNDGKGGFEYLMIRRL